MGMRSGSSLTKKTIGGSVREETSTFGKFHAISPQLASPSFEFATITGVFNDSNRTSETPKLFF